MLQIVRNYLLKAIALVGVFGVIVLLARLFGFRLDDLQVVLFPAVLVGVFLFSRQQRIQMPLLVVFSAFIAWGAAAAYTYGFIPSAGQKGVVAISRLSYPEVSAQHITMKRNCQRELAKRETLKLREIERNLSDYTLSERQSFFRTHPALQAAVVGDASWPTLMLKPYSEAGVSDLAEDWGDDLAPYSVAVSPEGLEVNLKIAVYPASAVVPGEPVDLFCTYLSWLSRGIKSFDIKMFEEDSPSRERSISRARGDFEEASVVLGKWRSPVPRALGGLAVASVDLMALANDDTTSGADSDCAVKGFRRAASYVPRADDKEVYAMIYNNAAVALMYQAVTAEDFALVKDWLYTAIKAAGRGDSPPLGARLAMANLRSLESAGLMQ